MKQFLTITLIFIFSVSSYAQKWTATQAEDTIVRYLKQMKEWRKKKMEGNTDSVYAFNKKLGQFMFDIGNEGFTLNADFKRLATAGMQVHTADDHMCRTFCWEIISYGGAHYYNYMVTYYQSATRAMSFLNKDGAAMTDIYSIKTYDNNYVYLLREENKYDYKNRYSKLVAYRLNEGYFTLTNFFFDSHDSSATAGYSYRLRSFTNKEEPLPQVKVTADKQQVIVPLVQEGGMIAGDMIYKFDGKRFMYSTYTERKQVKKKQ